MQTELHLLTRDLLSKNAPCSEAVGLAAFDQIERRLSERVQDAPGVGDQVWVGVRAARDLAA